MIRHIVLFKFKAEIESASREDFVQKLQSLSSLPMVRYLSVGTNFTESPRAYDIGLIVDVDDRAALEAYGNHSLHIPVKEMAARLCSTFPLVDYELT